MAFIQNHEAATNLGELKPDGDYEAIITVVEERTTNNGKTGLNLTMVIRNCFCQYKTVANINKFL